MHESLLAWKNYRYLKWFMVLFVISVAVFVSQFSNAAPVSGGTWQGYMLGTVGALLIVLLAFLGIRKRRYRSRLGRVEGWASAHVYLGILVIFLSAMHSALELQSLNVHTLAFWLTFGVVVSGIFGLYVYLHVPILMSGNQSSGYPDLWFEELKELDQRILDTTAGLRGEVVTQILSALRGTELGGSKADQLFGRDRSKFLLSPLSRWKKNTDQRPIIICLAETLPVAQRKGINAESLAEIFEFFGRRQQLLRRLRKDVQYRAILKIWLYFHVPLTFALLVALAVHIFVIFYYW